MIALNLDLETGVAKLAATTTIKIGAQVLVRINTFRAGQPASPGDAPVFALALGSQEAEPAVLAYLDEFAAENDNTFTGTLDANDSRLIDYMAGKLARAVDLELSWTEDTERQIAPNVAITVQPRVVSGPETSEGGPVYLTAAQVQALIDGVVAQMGAFAALTQEDQADGKTYRMVFVHGVPSSMEV